jgi:hypothetical protein
VEELVSERTAGMSAIREAVALDLDIIFDLIEAEPITTGSA